MVRWMGKQSNLKGELLSPRKLSDGNWEQIGIYPFQIFGSPYL